MWRKWWPVRTYCQVCWLLSVPLEQKGTGFVCWCFIDYLALINRVAGLYGRILREVASTDGTQWGLCQQPRSRFSHTDRPSSVKKMLLCGQTRKQRNKNINCDFIFACSFLRRTQICQCLLVFFTCFLVKVHWFFHLVLLTGTSQFFDILCL